MLDCILKGRRGIATAEFICGEIITTEKPRAPWDRTQPLSRAQCETFLGSATGMDRSFLLREPWSLCDQSAAFYATQKRKQCYALRNSTVR